MVCNEFEKQIKFFIKLNYFQTIPFHNENV